LLTITCKPEKVDSYWGATFNQTSNIDFTWAELCKCAVTVGRQSWDDVLKYGTYSGLEILWRLATLRSSLREGSNGRLEPSDAFKAPDPSEKTAILYFLGTFFAKLVLEKLFGVPWLLHFDVYGATLNGYLAFNR
jgi:hypothetical protein